jgi:hypothetical protein
MRQRISSAERSWTKLLADFFSSPRLGFPQSVLIQQLLSPDQRFATLYAAMGQYAEAVDALMPSPPGAYPEGRLEAALRLAAPVLQPDHTPRRP